MALLCAANPVPAAAGPACAGEQRDETKPASRAMTKVKFSAEIVELQERVRGSVLLIPKDMTVPEAMKAKWYTFCHLSEDEDTLDLPKAEVMAGQFVIVPGVGADVVTRPMIPLEASKDPDKPLEVKLPQLVYVELSFGEMPLPKFSYLRLSQENPAFEEKVVIDLEKKTALPRWLSPGVRYSLEIRSYHDPDVLIELGPITPPEGMSAIQVPRKQQEE